MSDVCLFDSSFSILSALGRVTGKPENSLRTVVTIKKIKSINIISGMEDVDIFDSTPDFLLNFIILSPQ